MKKGIMISTVCAVISVILVFFCITVPFPSIDHSEEDPEFYFKTNEKTIQIDKNGWWEDFEIKGVNMGSGYPGYFPNDDGIDKKTYYRWFNMISEMNANTIRVYKLQSPEFYTALKQYNEEHQKKIYLIQNVDFPDKFMYSEDSVFDSESEKNLINNTKKVVDAIHGKYISFDKKNEKLKVYIQDVSDYVLGYILGVEWDDTFVEYVSRSNSGEKYEGKYISGIGLETPFESFLARWGDELMTYETERYHMQHLISYGNWADTDPFINEIQIEDRKNIESEVDTDHIVYNDKVKTGMFSSYNIYPYYPLFLQYGEYTKYIDETGSPNPYRKYLMELVEHHKYPVVVTEYGTPASRSVAHDDRWRNISHGGLNEEEQGNAIEILYQDIKKAGCAGSMVFSWQDEWYKRAWNEMALSDPNGRAFWNNVQCAEQLFGILAFEPGKKGKGIYPDGDFSEWESKDLVVDQKKTKVSMKEDERYLHIFVKGLDYTQSRNYINLAFDITPKSGTTKVGDKTFERPIDFIIQINKDGDSAIYVQDDYDVMVYSVFALYYDNTIGGLERLKEDYFGIASRLSGAYDFSVVSRPDNHEKEMASAKPTVNEVGQLKQGNANPDSKEFDSNADYFVRGDSVEIRIPWQLLNFTDPSKCKIIDDLVENNYAIKGLKIDQIYVAPYFDQDSGKIGLEGYRLKGWKKPQWHERKKNAYYVLQRAFEGE